VEAALKLPLNQIHPLLRVLVNQGSLVKVKEDLYFHSKAIAQLKADLVAFLKENGEITTPQFKNLTQTSRKFTIPLSEYFDVNRVTVRVGESRRLREGV
jgi:selenocysteine-specific elongation factor